MNRILKFRPVLALTILAMLTSCTTLREDHRAERAKQAEHISAAFAEGDARAWRLGTARELAVIRALPTRDLDRALLGYRDVIAERGAQGLEPLVLASVAELASRGHYESERAKEHLGQMRKAHRINDKVAARPNAYAPVMRPQNRQVHYLPLSVAQAMLQQAMVSGRTGLNRIAADTLCSDEALFEFRQRWGDDKANLLEELCRGNAANAALESAFPGITGGISAYDCEISQEPTRAERLTSAIQDCLQSTVAHGGGNPLGDSSGGRYGVSNLFADIFPIRQTSETIERTTDGHRVRLDLDAAGLPVKETTFLGDGNISRRYFRGDGSHAFTMSGRLDQVTPNNEMYGAVDLSHTVVDPVSGVATQITHHTNDGGIDAIVSGDVDYSEARVNGQVVERIDNNADGSYTVTRPGGYSQTYDKNNQPVPADSAALPPPKGADPSEWGATAECRALNLMLAEEQLRGDLESDGIVSPKVVNPNPDTGGDDGEGVPCFASINVAVDSGMLCSQLTSSCPVNFILNEQCGCEQALPAGTPSSDCQYLQMCSDGSVSTENPQTGICSCGDSEPPEFVDPWAGGGPEPEPIRGISRRSPFD